MIFEINHHATGLKNNKPDRHPPAKELHDYKHALDQSAIIAITDQKGKITYVNENFCRISKYSREELLGRDHRIINSHFHDSSYIKNLWTTIAKGNVWRGEFRNKAKDGTFYWVDTTIVPFLNARSKPYQYLSIRYDITDRKNMETLLACRKEKEQLKITAKVLEAQEKERSAIGMELHDSVNQILAAIKIQLSIIEETQSGDRRFVTDCITNVQKVIDENRRIAHGLVTPDFSHQSLVCRMSALAHEMLQRSGITVCFNFGSFRESLLTNHQKLAIYRVAQEQCSNIIKYSGAKKVVMTMSTENLFFTMTISDDGKGAEPAKKSTGIGLANINTRLGIFNGKSSVHSDRGKGYALEVTMPVGGIGHGEHRKRGHLFPSP